LNHGSAGLGTANPLNAERFRIGAGIDAVHVPFEGTPENATELLAGRLDCFFCPVKICLPLINDGRMVALAMGSSKRSAVLPDLPTTVELGVPGSDYGRT
jgi:tripartite-type tricarboxylate transporter receptor subunit TctC